MPTVRYKVTLTQEERAQLVAMTTKGKHNAQSILNALILLNCDCGEFQDEKKSGEDVASVLRISARKVDRVKERFVENGLDAALNKQVSERPDKRKVDGDLEAHVVALACTTPPEGRASWSLRLLADKAVELRHVESLSHETVRQILKKTNSSHGKATSGSSRRKRMATS